MLCGFFRRIAAGITALALAVSLLALVSAPAKASGPVRLSSFEAHVLAVINRMRKQHRLRPLQLCSALTEAARQHTSSMAEDGYFSHASVDGSPFAARLLRFYGTGRFRSWAVGENLLWASPSIDATSALRLWLASPEHRANLLSPTWRQIGVAAVENPSAPGVYDGQQVTIITTDFGARR